MGLGLAHAPSRQNIPLNSTAIVQVITGLVIFSLQIKTSHGQTFRRVVCFDVMLCLFDDVDQSQTKFIEVDRWRESFLRY